MKLFRITSCEFVHDLSGQGAYLFGGRWNSAGTRLLYTAEHASLAMLEALAHITMIRQSKQYCKIVLDLREAINDLQARKAGRVGPVDWYREVSAEQLPADWRNNPGPDQLRQLGDAFSREGKYLALKVPSVLEPDSYNFLLNPDHPSFSLIRELNVSQVSFDQRLVAKK
ncbi:MAG TPA: RES family NAD+ phosphorylase [Phnomibacter sp.]|nr:RES family NAD+ phosphorylase [Phnomibacter sp.]